MKQNTYRIKVKRWSSPITGLGRPRGFQEIEAHRFQENRQMNVVRLSALRTGCPYHHEIFLVFISVLRLSQPVGYCSAGRIMSIKNSNGAIGSRTPELPACSAVPQPTAPPRDSWLTDVIAGDDFIDICIYDIWVHLRVIMLTFCNCANVARFKC